MCGGLRTFGSNKPPAMTSVTENILLGIGGTVHLAHAALAQLPRDLVVGDGLPYHAGLQVYVAILDRWVWNSNLKRKD